jgi:hypothetical protein
MFCILDSLQNIVVNYYKITPNIYLKKLMLLQTFFIVKKLIKAVWCKKNKEHFHLAYRKISYKCFFLVKNCI